MRFIFFLYVSILLATDENAPFQRTRDREVDIHHIKIDVAVDIESESVRGHVVHTFSPLSSPLESFSLDADDMIIRRVRMGNEDLEFIYSDSKLNINFIKPLDWKDTVDIRIDYSSMPRKGTFFVKPDKTYPNKPFQAWTQGEDMDNHHWVPIYDYPNDKATFETILTVKTDLKAISNGELLSIKDNKNGTHTWHWRENYPMVAYLISYAIGDYVQVKDKYKDIPVNYWVYKENQSETLRSFGLTTDMMKYFGDVTGIEYPYEKYDQVILDDFMFGGMENITLTHNTDRTMYDQYAAPDVSSEGLVAHELAHQWFGDMLTTRNWAHAWLNEGFATFLSRKYREHKFGLDEGEYIRFGEIKGYFRSDKRWRRSTVQHHFYESMDVFDGHIYAKGSLILNMIHDYLGEDSFWRFIKHYTKLNQYKNVETPDLKKSIEETTGQNMDWFFKQWVYEPGYPEYEVKWNYNQRNNAVKLFIEQTQDLKKNNLFKMPMKIQIDDELHTVWVEEQDMIYEIPVKNKPKMVIFNSGMRIPCKIVSNKPISEWIYQLKNGTNSLDRISAAKALGSKRGRSNVEKALLEVIKKDQFWGVRLEAVNAFSSLKSKKYSDQLINISYDQDNRVRRAIFRSLKNYKNNENVSSFLQDIVKNDSKYYSVSDAFKSLVVIDTLASKQLVESLIKRESHNDIIRKSAITYYGSVINDKNYERLVELSEYGGTSWDARSEAVRQLGKYAKEKPETLEIFVNLLKDNSREVRRNSVRMIATYGDKKNIGDLDEVLAMDPIISRDVRNAKKRILNPSKKSTKSIAEKELGETKKILRDIQKLIKY